MNQLFVLTMMISSLSAPDLDLNVEQLSIDLQQAQTWVLTDPAKCVQLSSAFLLRTANSTPLSSSHQDASYREPITSYSTAQQTIGANLLKGKCLVQLGQYQPSMQAFDQALVLAEKEGFPELTAHGLYLKIRSQEIRPSREDESRQLLARLEMLLTEPSLQNSPLQVYSRLLRTTYDIANKRFADAQHQLADARIWAAKRPEPLTSAWVSATSGDLYRALLQPQLALGEYIDAQQQAKEIKDPLFLGFTDKPDRQALSRTTRPAKSTEIRH